MTELMVEHNGFLLTEMVNPPEFDSEGDFIKKSGKFDPFKQYGGWVSLENQDVNLDYQKGIIERSLAVSQKSNQVRTAGFILNFLQKQESDVAVIRLMIAMLEFIPFEYLSEVKIICNIMGSKKTFGWKRMPQRKVV